MMLLCGQAFSPKSLTYAKRVKLLALRIDVEEKMLGVMKEFSNIKNTLENVEKTGDVNDEADFDTIKLRYDILQQLVNGYKSYQEINMDLKMMEEQRGSNDQDHVKLVEDYIQRFTEMKIELENFFNLYLDDVLSTSQ
jgi:protein subunit release factor A